MDWKLSQQLAVKIQNAVVFEFYVVLGGFGLKYKVS